MKKFMLIRMIIYIVSISLVALVVLGKMTTSCYFLDNYGLLCPACGLTRATIAIVSFDIQNAMKYNLFYTVVLMPLLTILILNDIYVFIKRFILGKKDISFIEIIFGEKNIE